MKKTLSKLAQHHERARVAGQGLAQHTWQYNELAAPSEIERESHGGKREAGAFNEEGRSTRARKMRSLTAEGPTNQRQTKRGGNNSTAPAPPTTRHPVHDHEEAATD